jgi:hypothetical protein
VFLLDKDKIIRQIMSFRCPGDEAISDTNRAKHEEAQQQASRVAGCCNDTERKQNYSNRGPKVTICKGVRECFLTHEAETTAGTQKPIKYSKRLILCIS